MSCCKITKYVLPSPFLANHGGVFPVYDTFCGCLVPRANIGTKNNNWLPQRRTGPWSISPCRKMDGPGREYPDTPGPGRRFPDRSGGVIVQKRKKFYVFFFAFQAILNTFYFWVKNLEKKYSKSQEDTPPPHNWKNILYLYFMFHAILSTFKFFWKNKYLIGTNGPVKFLPARSDFVVFIYP